MKSYLTAARLATKLQMLLCGKKSKLFVAVEGVTDFRLYSKVFVTSVCEIVVGESKQNVVEAVILCNEKHLQGVIGIVDADFWHMDKQQIPENIFITDSHDLETMLINSKAYENVLLEYGDGGKVNRFEMRKKKTIKETLLENVALVGYLRKLSLTYEWGFNFNHLDFKEFTTISDLAIEEERLIKSLVFHCKKQEVKNSEMVIQILHQTISPQDDLWQVCCGHDLMELMTLGFIHLFGNYNAKKMIVGQLEGSFRLAYQDYYFKQTKLYESLCKWEEKHEKYHLFMESIDKI